ncbi:MAG TPA: glycosyltransferase [Verrucomicrobiae bacterium]|nr:glycosyltransferase [Verrucomicrobiae bacterium]
MFSCGREAETRTEPATPLQSGSTAALRILQFNSRLTGGGTDEQCLGLAEGLLELEQSVWIVGPDSPWAFRRTREKGICFEPVKGPYLASLPLIWRAARLMRTQRIQIIHAHHGRDIWPTILAARLSGRRPKIVISRHMAKSPSSWFSRRFLLKNCDAVVAVSKFVQKVLCEGVYEPETDDPERRARPPLQGDHKKIHVIYGGIDTNRFRPFDALAQRKLWSLNRDNFVFGVAGAYQLPRGKGQRQFLLAASKIHTKIPEARFLIIGRGNMADVLRAEIIRLGLIGKAWLTPYCDDMPAAMNAIDCLVHPAIGTEAFGLVLCEAFACGKPVIASNLDGIPEAFSFGNYGQLVTPGSIEGLASAMLNWAQQPPKQEMQKEEVHRNIAEQFSFITGTRRMLGLYKTLLGDRRAADAS